MRETGDGRVGGVRLYQIPTLEQFYFRGIYPGLLVIKINKEYLFVSECHKGNISTRLHSPVPKDNSPKSQSGLTP